MDQALQVFLTAAEQRNFTRAAELLHMTQPAVSSYIRGLEQTLDCKLLERTNKYVRLTQAGEVVYAHAKEILGLYTRMGNVLDDLKHTAHGPLSIGASYTFGEYILPSVVAELVRKYPSVQPVITIANSSEITELVSRRQLDAGIVEGEDGETDGVRTIPFAEDRMVVAVSARHPLAHRHPVEGGDLAEASWIMREKGSGTRELQEKALAQLGIHPKSRMIFGSTQAIKEYIEAGMGVALLSQWTIRKEIQMGALKALELPGFPLRRHFSLVMPNMGFQTKASKVFTGFLIENHGFPELL
ncbi:LysR family transcriptional regulator [Paenibacillus sp. YN15]|uniref:LysR family transcriptional regulator n=1 Tax=Paenibacillus sp. YN15 TaxID=1742774 RepID=UPI000DCDB915|nr:LysR family transcriptional regulator [Paenibacillus sp. YN15]RAV03583.1 LysR family transcriptional regulator [Paenibacillus sp. YN15]